MFENKNRDIIVAIESIFDTILNIASMIMAYMFAVLVCEPGRFTHNSTTTVIFVFVVVILQYVTFMIFNVYAPLPYLNPGKKNMHLLRVNALYYLLTLVVSGYFYGKTDLKFIFFWILFSGIIGTAVLLYKRRMTLRIKTFFKKRNYTLRKVIIIGDNSSTVEDFVNQVSKNPQYGMLIIGYVGDKIHPNVGCEKLGSFKDLSRVLDEYSPSDAVFAIDAYDKKRLIKLVNLCDDRCIKVYFLPVIYGFFKNSRQIESVGSMPVINIHSTPLDNQLNAAVKRVVDVIGSLALIVLTSPIMLAAAIGVKISSPGPILFKQERVGKMGKRFVMLKFRSMKVNVDSDSAWSSENDDRKTKFGAFLRKTSIDELPQLFNVLGGSMSLVGPRPEVPHFVEYFRERIPLYMVKHYVKPGMTGQAQVKGLRGDTSVEDRIHEDIEYIEHWSLMTDISILLKTPFKAINKAERYVENSDADDENTVDTDVIAECFDSSEKCGITPDGEDVVSDIEPEAPKYKGRILYAASNMQHINNFHLGYIARLRKEGYFVKVMARGEGADYNVPFEKKMFSPSNTACRAEIGKILARERFDAIILNTSLAAFHIRFALPKVNRPRVVNIVHGYLFSKHINPLKALLLLTVEKLVASRTDEIIVMNESDRHIAERYKLCLGKVRVSRGMGASVREPMTPIEKIRRESLSEDKYALAFVGELSKRKNQKFLIDALNDIKEKIPNATLWLVGDGPGEEALRSYAGEVDLSSSVYFFGSREDACDIMRAADLYVSASTIEGMPFNIIEAMGCGKTILASRIKGHTDIIEDGVSGFTFKYGSKKDFVDKVVKIHSHELSVKESDVYARYHDFDNKNVFLETYGMVKEALSDER